MDDLSERLFAHFVGGRWRVPFGTARLNVPRPDGTKAGSVVLAEARDLARAQGCVRGGGKIACDRAAQALATLGMAEAIVDAPLAKGPFLLTLDAEDRQLLGAALGAGVQSGVIWCPPPHAALFATEIAIQLQSADLPPGCFALLHAFTPQTAPLIHATGLISADYR